MRNIDQHSTTCVNINKFTLGILVGILVLMPNMNCIGQAVINGRVISGQHEKLSGISVLAIPARNASSILTYAITDEAGNYKLSYSSASDSVFIAFKSLNYKDTVVALINQSQKLDIELQPDVFEIREVNVKGNPVSVRGDTINYIVNSFAKASDRSIGDVISRMPGFEVTDLGQIYYQGKPIQKYYIEGLDLLDGRYALANKNLPHQSVGSVEVLRNHQPVKMLEDKIASDATSINIKLKNDVAITGTLYAATGFSPLLRDVNLTPMLFHKKQQVIISWQSNNTATDLSTQHQPLEMSGGELMGLNNRKPDLTSILDVPQPQIDKKTYLSNNANLLSYNHLIKLSNESELKINSSFYHDIINESGEVATSYFIAGDTVLFTEITKNKFYNKSLSTEFSLIQNDKKRYLTNKLSINKFWDSERGLIKNESDEVNQKAETPHFSITNDFDVIVPVKRNFVQFYSSIDFNNSPQSLTVSPGIFEDALNGGNAYQLTTQKFGLKKLVAKNFVQFTIVRDGWKYETKTGVNYENQKLETSIEKDEQLILADSLQNSLHWTYADFYFSETLKYERSKLWLSFELPFNFHYYRTKDTKHRVPDKLQKLLFTPSFSLKCELNGYWIWRMGAGYSNKLADVNTMAQGYVFSNYRHLKRGIDQQNETRRFRFNFGLEYKNPVSGLFSSLVWMSNYSTHNLLLKQQVNASGLLFYEVIDKKNQSKLNNITFTINQYLAGLKVTFDFKSYYNQQKKEYLLNGEMDWLNYKVFALHPGITVSRWRKVDLEYSYRAQLFHQISGQAEFSVLEQRQKGSVFYNPEKRHLFGLTAEHYNTKQTGQQNANLFFAHFSYHLKPSKGKFKYKLEIRNIFNQSEMVLFNNSDISLVKTSYSMRPRQFLATISIGL